MAQVVYPDPRHAFGAGRTLDFPLLMGSDRQPYGVMTEHGPLFRSSVKEVWQALAWIYRDRKIPVRLVGPKRLHPGPYGPLRNPESESGDDWRSLYDRTRDNAARPAEMPDITARALAAGAQPPLTYLGTGMTGTVVEDAKHVGFKVARRYEPVTVRMIGEEAEWLQVAGQVPWVKDRVVRIFAWRPDVGVIVREAVHGKSLPWGGSHQREAKGRQTLGAIHNEIQRLMLAYGFTSPEFKEESYVVVQGRGPVLFDASMPAKVGRRLAAEALALTRRVGGDPFDLSMVAFQVRREADPISQSTPPTLSKRDANRILARLRAAGVSAESARYLENPLADETPDETPAEWRARIDGRIARKKARAQELAASVGPRGTLFRALDPTRADVTYVLSPRIAGDTGSTWPWRMTRFDRIGAYGHTYHATPLAAVTDVLDYFGDIEIVERANPRPLREGDNRRGWPYAVQRETAEYRLAKARGKRAALAGITEHEKVRGLELESVRDPRYVFIITPGVQGEGRWQITSFFRYTEGGLQPTGHMNAATLGEAVQRAVDDSGGELRRTAMANPPTSPGLRVEHSVDIDKHLIVEAFHKSGPKLGKLIVRGPNNWETAPDGRRVASVASIQVEKAFHRKGIGTALYARATEVLGAQGVYLASDVTEQMSPMSTGFWEKQVTKGRARRVKLPMYWPPSAVADRYVMDEALPPTLENPRRATNPGDDELRRLERAIQATPHDEALQSRWIVAQLRRGAKPTVFHHSRLPVRQGALSWTTTLTFPTSVGGIALAGADWTAYPEAWPSPELEVERILVRPGFDARDAEDQLYRAINLWHPTYTVLSHRGGVHPMGNPRRTAPAVRAANPRRRALPPFGMESPPYGARVPRAAFEQQDFYDSVGRVSPASVKKDYGTDASPRARVYPAWFAIDGLPSPRMADEGEATDWDEFRSRFARPFPVLKVQIDKRGVRLIDGNHRLHFWSQVGMTHVPAWVVDDR